jgi:polysaccharide export outer membrane protein
MKKTLCILLIIVFALISSQAFGEEKKSTVKLGSIGETLVDSYQIGIGDILEITTWKEPDFTRESVLVRTDGKISFPLVNDFPAAGLSPMELKYNLEVALKAYVRRPSGGYGSYN